MVQQCCDLAEGCFLLDENEPKDTDQRDIHKYQSDWGTFNPEFLQQLDFNYETQPEIAVDWESVPESIHPQNGELGDERASNKQLQIEAMLRYILPMIDERLAMREEHAKKHNLHLEKLKVVDFGAGSGHLGLIVAHLRSVHCDVTLVERKEYACQQARRRSRQAFLEDVVTIAQMSLHEFSGFDPLTNDMTTTTSPLFDLGISLHSCGVLTDAVLELCIQHRASFCLCPCCYGQAAKHLPDEYLPRCHTLRFMHDMPTPQLSVNKSKDFVSLKDKRLCQRMGKIKPFYHIASAADCTSAANTLYVHSDNFRLAKRCMQVIDVDRLLWVRDLLPLDYNVSLADLEPLDITPKNNILLGTTNNTTFTCTKTEFRFIALAASCSENEHAEEGERQKTGQKDFAISKETD